MARKPEYNPRGLKLKAIFAKMHAAYDMDADVQMRWPPRDLDVQPFNGFTQAPTYPADGGFTMLAPTAIKGQIYNILDADTLCVKETDKALAEEIKAHPILMLLSRRHADAVARWTYGRRHSIDPSTRKESQSLLDAADILKSPAGATPKFKGNIQLLREAYHDLVEYGDGLKACLDAVSSAKIIRTHFPDVEDAAPYYRHPPLQFPLSKEHFPTGDKFALNVFAQRIGWCQEQVRKKIKSSSQRHRST